MKTTDVDLLLRLNIRFVYRFICFANCLQLEWLLHNNLKFGSNFNKNRKQCLSYTMFFCFILTSINFYNYDLKKNRFCVLELNFLMMIFKIFYEEAKRFLNFRNSSGLSWKSFEELQAKNFIVLVMSLLE